MSKTRCKMEWIKQIFTFLVVLLLQVLLIGNLHLMGICHPYIYVVFLLMMPIRLPKIADMLIGAAVGLIIDICYNSLGTHMAACVALMYFRRNLIENTVMDHDRISGDINRQSIGAENFIRLVLILIPIHHGLVFAVSAWSIAHIGFTILEIVVSSLVTIALILGYDFTKK